MQPLVDFWATNGTFPQGSEAHEYANIQAGERLLQLGVPEHEASERREKVYALEQAMPRMSSVNIWLLTTLSICLVYNRHTRGREAK